MGHHNRLHVAMNPAQGSFPKVLCVCSAGCLRSPTAAVVLASPPFNFNTRTVGTDEGWALVSVDDVLMEWADEVVCMESRHARDLRVRFPDASETPVTVLDIEDEYPYRDDQLIGLIVQRYREVGHFRERIQ